MTHPPQQGPGPYGQQPYPPQQPQQPQPGYGYPQQPQQPYPPQGQVPPQQQWGAPQGQQQWGAPPPPPAPGRKMSIKTMFRIGFAVVAVIVLAVVWFMSRDDADQAEAGDCLKNNGSTSAPDLQVVECGDTKAEYKVVEVIKDTLDKERCQGKSDIGYYEQTSGSRRHAGKQFVLCLNEIKK
ncbi:hypothetical protein ABT160_08625 [Streptomyces sp. NPDC001941]|uniref:LppU/SCO3897 family protein n=1 Tax=Streptomyces sp. NPDC001941 TaxID=3154659 RepID=UPI00332CD8D0